MTMWPVQDAKTRFDELLAACLEDGPQIVTERGTEAAVLVPIDEWRRLAEASRPSLKALLLSSEPRVDIPIAERGRLRLRDPEPPV